MDRYREERVQHAARQLIQSMGDLRYGCADLVWYTADEHQAIIEAVQKLLPAARVEKVTVSKHFICVALPEKEESNAPGD